MLNINWKEIRKETGMTQLNFSLDAGISKHTYMNYENNKYSPNMDTTLDLLSVAGYTLELVKVKHEL